MEENPESQMLLEEKKKIPFKYEFVDKDLIAYMKDIILTYTTEEASVNIENKLFLVTRI